MDDVWDKDEMLRLAQPDQNWELRYLRWHNIYTWYYEGKTLDEIAKHYALSTDSIKQVLRKAARAREVLPGFRWPEKNGRPLCDFAHRFPRETPTKVVNPDSFWHARARIRGGRIFCPVCLRTFDSTLHVVYTADMRARRALALKRNKKAVLQEV